MFVGIGGLCPDFVNCNGKKVIIELFGDYWHDLDEEGYEKIILRMEGKKCILNSASRL